MYSILTLLCPCSFSQEAARLFLFCLALAPFHECPSRPVLTILPYPPSLHPPFSAFSLSPSCSCRGREQWCKGAVTGKASSTIAETKRNKEHLGGMGWHGERQRYEPRGQEQQTWRRQRKRPAIYICIKKKRHTMQVWGKEGDEKHLSPSPFNSITPLASPRVLLMPPFPPISHPRLGSSPHLWFTS